MNYPLSVIKNPAGTYSYVGSIPHALGEPVPATKSDVAGGRAYWGPNKKGLFVTKFPVFKTRADAVAHASEYGFTVTD